MEEGNVNCYLYVSISFHLRKRYFKCNRFENAKRLYSPKNGFQRSDLLRSSIVFICFFSSRLPLIFSVTHSIIRWHKRYECALRASDKWCNVVGYLLCRNVYFLELRPVLAVFVGGWGHAISNIVYIVYVLHCSERCFVCGLFLFNKRSAQVFSYLQCYLLLSASADNEIREF